MIITEPNLPVQGYRCFLFYSLKRSTHFLNAFSHLPCLPKPTMLCNSRPLHFSFNFLGLELSKFEDYQNKACQLLVTPINSLEARQLVFLENNIKKRNNIQGNFLAPSFLTEIYLCCTMPWVAFCLGGFLTEHIFIQERVKN